MATVSDPRVETKASARRFGFAALAPYILGLYFACSAMWGFWKTDIIDTDAARHAMNGAFIYDLVRTGHLLHPVEYAEQYYGHLPALSMPYHPPLFPAIEALFFAIFGVKLVAARLAVATAVVVSAVLLFRLVEKTFGNRVLAGCITITMLSLWTSEEVARDVMLEFPAMAFMLAAIYFLHDWDTHFRRRDALAFAIFASLAFWTKQHAVLAGGIPPLYSILTGRWRLLLRRRTLLALSVFAAVVSAYIFLSSHFHNAGIQEVAVSKSDLKWIALRTIPAYVAWMAADFTGLPAVFATVALGLFTLGYWTRRHNTLRLKLGIYWCWILSTTLILVDSGNTNSRYLFFLYPAVIAIAYAYLFQGASRLWGDRAAAAVAVVFAALWFIHGFWDPIEYLRGPGEAAKAVVQGQPVRVLYAGEAEGNFIFAGRSLDPKLELTVIPSSKVPAGTFQPAELESFCHMYGVDWLILENVPGQHTWSNLRTATPDFLKLEKTIPLESTRERWKAGTIEIFKVLGKSSTPGGVLKLPIRRFGVDIPVKL
ncbi:MAG: glycosyltransferase family 39 protein [Bryobacterales bacterium]|nr:glycosyltransferase family 39 protein [Bryobacterales bacterium]MBV9396385.1 glycosyltransferase family 39 protein [Bryobacterales bacterium]